MTHFILIQLKIFFSNKGNINSRADLLLLQFFFCLEIEILFFCLVRVVKKPVEQV